MLACMGTPHRGFRCGVRSRGLAVDSSVLLPMGLSPVPCCRVCPLDPPRACLRASPLRCHLPPCIQDTSITESFETMSGAGNAVRDANDCSDAPFQCGMAHGFESATIGFYCSESNAGKSDWIFLYLDISMPDIAEYDMAPRFLQSFRNTNALLPMAD